MEKVQDVETVGYKERVMQVLANAPLNDLSRKEFLWAASNLPDSKERGEFSFKSENIVIEHHHDNIFECFGITKSDIAEYGDIMKDGIEFQQNQPEEEQQNSKAIEHMINNPKANKKFYISLLIKMMNDLSQNSRISGLEKMLGAKAMIIKGSDLPGGVASSLSELRSLIEMYAKLKGGSNDKKEDDKK